ncbi:hypothetical protein GJA_3992 [Janthinobacterium agaricidamnosum NBRC 102515 = DSM 9628]|uniref:Uncharacterized protein n=1 Tax=Janthinobacterium agaricidamnosum NBRC 102515 = DSM 9628 TaxID=1349767 RepID=W0VB69_9BURK|nr:hypothetical protein GJA_3992 [Janthinobacterium agaricidamnosum NBRC 102515 = DSM 9628]
MPAASIWPFSALLSTLKSEPGWKVKRTRQKTRRYHLASRPR